MISDSLYPRLFLPFAAALALATFLAWWLAVTVIGHALEQRAGANLVRASTVLASEGLPLTQDLLQRTSLLAEALVFVFDAQGNPVAGSPTTALSAETLRAAYRKGAELPVAITLHDSPHLLVVRRLPAGRDQRYAAVGTAASLADVRNAARRAGLALGIAALAATALLAWIGHRIARSITGPVQELSALAVAIAGGDRSARVTRAARGEMAQLASALNDMAHSLEVSENELAQQNRLAALGEMAARIAHEVRNPLTAIKLQLQLLQERVHGDSAAKVTALLDEMRRLELIVESTLETSRPTTLKRTSTDLNRLVADVTSLMGPQLTHRGIELSLHTGTVPLAQLDPDRVKQVLLNLLNNSADALPDGGRVRISTCTVENPDRIGLIVEDNGPGIPATATTDLFDAPVTSNSGGLGVGLLLTRELAELHGGTISMDSSPTLGGARLSVYFPLSGAPDGQSTDSR